MQSTLTSLGSSQSQATRQVWGDSSSESSSLGGLLSLQGTRRPAPLHTATNSPIDSNQTSAKRERFTIPQVDALENYFNNTNASPNKTEIDQLLAQDDAFSCEVTPQRLTRWFRSRRYSTSIAGTAAKKRRLAAAPAERRQVRGPTARGSPDF